MKALKDSWKRLRGWADRNMASIFTGWIVALVMSVIIIIKGMESTSREVNHLKDKIELSKENHELTETVVMQFEMINDLVKTSSSQRQGLGRATETLNEQSVLIHRLVEYLKSINHWPPKANPPKPPDPDKWI